MKLRFILSLAALLAAAPLQAAFDAFLKIEGVKGESRDETHKDQIEILSFSWGVSNPSVAGGQGGKASFQDISFTKVMDKSSPLLMLGCASGRHYPEVILYLRTPTNAGAAGPVTYLTITLTDVMVTSFQVSGHGGDSSARPTEQFSLNYAKIKLEYVPINPDGRPGDAVFFDWNLVDLPAASK